MKKDEIDGVVVCLKKRVVVVFGQRAKRVLQQPGLFDHGT